MSEKRWKINYSRNSLKSKRSFIRENEQLQSIQQEKMVLIDELRNVQGKTVNVSEITMNTDCIKQMPEE